MLDAVLKRASPIHELYARHAHGPTLINNRYADWNPEQHAYGVQRGVLFGVVHRALQKENVTLVTNAPIVSRSIERDGVYLQEADGKRHGPFDFIINGDGARSRLREAFGFHAHVTRYNHGTLWINAPGVGVPGQLLQVVRGNRRLFGLMPVGDGLCTLYWGLPVREFAGIMTGGLSKLKQEIADFAPEAEPILDFIHHIDQLLLTTYQHVSMRKTFDRHCIFIGDAAHAMSPHTGQGINLAMLDAYVLSQCLEEAATPWAAFHRYRARRCAHQRYYALVTYALSPFFQSDWPILGWGRDRVLPWMHKLPWVGTQMGLTMSGLKGDFLRGPITL